MAKPEDEIPVTRVNVTYEKPAEPVIKAVITCQGAVDHIVAEAISPELAAHPGAFRRVYLCSACGEEGAVASYALAAGGTVECPHCHQTMMATGSA